MGKVILLVGPSCAGKSTIARAIQQTASDPYLVLSLDGLFASVDDRWGSGGAFRDAGFAYAHDTDGSTRVVYGDVGRGMLQGMRQAVAAYARAGVNVVFDDMLLDETALPAWAGALVGVDALLVRLTAPFELLLERETTRPHRRTPGLVAGHKPLHDAIDADLVVDTAANTPAEAAALVLNAQAAPMRVLS
jgi:chloramphenicol 3-O phosphotransferase